MEDSRVLVWVLSKMYFYAICVCSCLVGVVWQAFRGRRYLPVIRIRQAAQLYLLERGENPHKSLMRFDLISVSGKEQKIEHFIAAF